jgi:enamine deaminase RidA (YjgF/YER057c/UK114 family)
LADAEVVDARGGIATPGLINTHHHMFQNLARAFTPIANVPLYPWIKGHMPLWKNLTPEALHLAGQVASTTKGGSVHDQTADILAQIDVILAEAGTDKTKLLSATIWLTDMATFGEMNAVWDSWVAAGCTPARATVEAKLAAPEYKVEIAVIAAR